MRKTEKRRERWRDGSGRVRRRQETSETVQDIVWGLGWGRDGDVPGKEARLPVLL